MNSEIASIWIKIGGKGQRSTLVCGIYREHTLIHENAAENSGHISQQKVRWKEFVRQWKHAATVKSCWIIGDTNLDALKWNQPDYEHEEMVELVKMTLRPKISNKLL